MAKSKVTDNGILGVSARVKAKGPNPKDYHIHRIEIEPAENGHVVTVGHRKNKDAEARDQKAEMYSPGLPDEKHVFKNHKQVVGFLKKKLMDSMPAGDGDNDEAAAC